MDLLKLVKDNSEKARTSLSSIIKIILILSIIYSIYFHLWRILFINLLLLIIIFIPTITKKYEIKIPKEIEFIILFFVLISFFLGDLRGLVIQIFFGIAIGFVGFAIMLILYSKSKVKANYFLIILFSISFSVALGTGLELLKYYTKIFLKTQILLADYGYAIISLTIVLAGSLLASLIGYIYMKGHKNDLMERLVQKFKKQNPNLFIKKTDSPEEVLELIKRGEGEKIEFKSTLRTNLHTNEVDRKVELACLKTITAFLNSEGGTLLVGVTDSGSITGTNKDNFQSNDRLALHFTNLIKEHIGNQYLPYIHFEIILLEGKHILKAECIKSNKPVFLRINKDEEFYIRIGPASVQITGSRLIEYIGNNFR